MKQYEPCIQNNNNNNNNNIKTKVKQEEGLGSERGRERQGSHERLYIFLFFLLFSSFSDLWKSDRRFSSGLKAKLIHATRATRGHQNLGVSSNSTR